MHKVGPLEWSVKIAAQLDALAEAMRDAPDVTSLGYAQRLVIVDTPNWRDDPSYFWAENTKRKRV
jgi:hypothetical protein